MTLVAEHPNPLAVLDAVIAGMRASGDTGHVEDLLQARADFAELIKWAAIVDSFDIDPESDDEYFFARKHLHNAIARIRSTP